MLKSALRSIKDDFSRSLFYWLIFVLTSMFMFLFFNLSYSDVVGVRFIHAKNDMATFTTVFVIAVCMIVIFFANDFYVKKKSKDLAMRLVCGGTYFQIARYLLYQTGILFLLAIPVGIGLSIICIPLINSVLSVYLNSSYLLVVSNDAISSTFLILFIEIIWCTVLNLGYSYRSSIHTLIHNPITYHLTVTFPFLFSFHISKKVKQFIAGAMFVCPIIMFYMIDHNPESIMVLAIVGMIGFYLSIDMIVIPLINEYINYRHIDQPEFLVYMGLIRNDLLLMKKNIILLIVSDIMILAILVTSLQNPIEVMLSIISFVVLNILLSLSIMFKYSTEIVTRRYIFQNIERLGYTRDKQNCILRKEVFGLYGFIIGVALFYILNIFCVLYLQQLLEMGIIICLILCFLIPLLICGFINLKYYQSKMLKESKNV